MQTQDGDGASIMNMGPVVKYFGQINRKRITKQACDAQLIRGLKMKSFWQIKKFQSKVLIHIVPKTQILILDLVM